MRILILCYEYPPIGGGGGRVAKSIGEQLTKKGHQVRVQTAGMKHLPAYQVFNGVEIFRTASFRSREDTCTVFEMGLFILTSLIPTLQHLRKWKPDVMHAHFAVPTGVIAYIANKLTGIPYVLTAHLGDVPGAIPEQTDRLFRWINPFANLIWKNAAVVTTVSEFVRTLAMKAYQRPVIKILNGIEPGPLISPGIHDPKQILSIGRFNPQKNLLFLIEVVSRLKDLNWKLTMVGDGPLMPAVKRQIAHYEMQNRIELPGWLPAEKVEQILKESDILLIPSTSEGLPMVAVEALKFGLAIVASDIEGLYDVVEQNANGYRLPVNDVNAFAEKMRLLLTDNETLQRMKNESRKKVLEFDLTAITTQYEEVLINAARNI